MTRMDEAAKRRLVGAAVLIALAVIFVPMLVEQDDSGLGEPIVIPDAPYPDADAELGIPRSDSADSFAAPDDELLPLPLPTPEPPPSARDAEPAAAESRAAPTSQTPASSAQRSPTAASSASTARSEPAARAPAGPKPLPPGTSAWVIQVASLGSPEAARVLQGELRSKGYPAFIEEANVRGRRFYRVRVGPEVERARADRLATQLAADTGGQPLVQRYP